MQIDTGTADVSVTKEEDVKEDEDVKEQDGEDDEDDEEDEEDKDDSNTHAIVVADVNETMKPQGEQEALENSKDETRQTSGRRRRRRPRREEENTKLNTCLPQSNQRSNKIWRSAQARLEHRRS